MCVCVGGGVERRERRAERGRMFEDRAVLGAASAPAAPLASLAWVVIGLILRRECRWWRWRRRRTRDLRRHDDGDWRGGRKLRVLCVHRVAVLRAAVLRGNCWRLMRIHRIHRVWDLGRGVCDDWRRLDDDDGIGRVELAVLLNKCAAQAAPNSQAVLAITSADIVLLAYSLSSRIVNDCGKWEHYSSYWYSEKKNE